MKHEMMTIVFVDVSFCANLPYVFSPLIRGSFIMFWILCDRDWFIYSVVFRSTLALAYAHFLILCVSRMVVQLHFGIYTGL